LATKLVYVVTHGVTANLLLRGQLRFLRARGYDITVVASPGADLDAVREREGVRTIGVEMSRDVRLQEGPAALVDLVRAFRALRPDIVNASTAKAGLLGMLAARAVGVRRRVYLVRGLRREGTTGLTWQALTAAEHLAARCSTHVVCVSESLRAAYVQGGFARLEKTAVIPSNGVDPSRFLERARTRERAALLRAELGIPPGAVVAGFVGRLVADKGIADLLVGMDAAWRQAPDLRLLLVGGDLAGDTLPSALSARLDQSRIVRVGTVSDPAPYYAAMDFLVFPSMREGLPNVPLEAGSCELPAIGYRSTGVVDAIADGVTGVIVDRGHSAALGEAIVTFARDAELRHSMGKAARVRVLERFTHERVWDAWARYLDGLMAVDAP